MCSPSTTTGATSPTRRGSLQRHAPPTEQCGMGVMSCICILLRSATSDGPRAYKWRSKWMLALLAAGDVFHSSFVHRHVLSVHRRLFVRQTRLPAFIIRDPMRVSHSLLLLLLVVLTLVSPHCRADCSASPPDSNIFLTASIGAGSTSAIASITCPSGQTAVSTYWDVRSSDGSSPFTFVISDGRGARDTIGPGTCTYAHGHLITLSSYATMSASVTCNNPTHFLGIGNKNCPISFNVGFQCTPFPPINFQCCQVDLANCPATSTLTYYSPHGSTNVINQFCCADGTTPVVDNTANTCHCGAVVLSSSGYAHSTYWIAPNATSVWIDAPVVKGGGSGQYSSTISPSLAGTGLSLLSWGGITSTGTSNLTIHPLTTYAVTMADTYNTGMAAVVIPISIAIQVETFSWARATTGDCSATCGGGSQSVDYVCVDQSGAVVDNSRCSPATRPPSIESCNTQVCSRSWVQTYMGACSVPCGGGVQMIEYACEDAQGVVVPTSECSSARPAASVSCNTVACQLPWAGTYTADHGCAQSHCCCAVGTVTITDTGSRLAIDTPQLAGQCGGQTSASATIAYPATSSFTTVWGGEAEIVTMSSDQQSITVIDPTAAACATTITRTSASNGAVGFVGSFSRWALLTVAVAAALAR